jgi:tRNA modification GTPase
MTETIVAVSSGLVESAIGVIRLSGPDALAILHQLTLSSSPPIPRQMFRTLIHVPQTQTILDDGMAVVFYSPHSYTGEDVVEWFGHGSLPILKEIVSACLHLGARLARPGEFTQRAFLNGKMDLSQAESVQQLIAAKTDAAAHVALEGVQGKIHEEIQSLRQSLVELLTALEGSLDFPDEIDFLESAEFLQKIETQRVVAQTIFGNSKKGKLLREGVVVAIAGRPNVGKSTLLNRLLGEERALTSHLPGTTRDTIEEWIQLEGVPVKLIDTAGLRDAPDEVEQMGVARAKRKLAEADVIVFLLDAVEEVTTEDEAFLSEYGKEKILVLWNKCDSLKNHRSTGILPVRASESTGKMPVRASESTGKMPVLLETEKQLFISAKTGEGIDGLLNAIKRRILSGELQHAGGVTLTSARQVEELVRASEALQRTEMAIRESMPLECVAVDLKAAIVALGYITGDAVSEEVIRNIFERFCVGK